MRRLNTIFAARINSRFEERETLETSIHMSIPATIPAVRLRAFSHACGLAVAALSLLALAGCSSSAPTAQIQVGAITFTDANATPQKQQPLTSLTVSQGTYVDVALSSDPKLLGVDWTAVCGSALPPGTPLPPGQTQDQSCGTFTPGHTMSGPLPSYAASAAGYVAFYTAPAAPPKQGIVTLYASATSDPTKFSTVTLTINGLPISVGFAPAPPTSLGLSTSTQFKAVLNNDATGAGVKWSVLCASSACGSFTPTQTASGVLTTYTTPATIPSGGTVQITATSIVDPTKSATATITILPISVSVTPAVLTVATAGTAPLTATVSNDGGNKGVDWSVSCTNMTTPGNCGTITAHTASGAVATYTAPSLANIAVGSAVTITATSTTDPTKSATSVVTTTKGNLVSGVAQAAQTPVRNALVTLYAATTRESVAGIDYPAQTTATTDQDGNFAIPYGYECPTPDTQMYLVSAGGNAGAGINPNLVLMAALGACAKLDASRFVIDEATTVAAVYALSPLMGDARHVGSNVVSNEAMVTAFATANELVDATSGLVRARTVSGSGLVPRTKIGSLANALSACASTAGSTQADGSACDLLFRATNPGTTPWTQATDTSQALLDLARNAPGFSNGSDSFATLFRLAGSSTAFSPALAMPPPDWTLVVQYPDGQGSGDTKPLMDAAGNVWMSRGNAVLEFVGAASYAGEAGNLVPVVVNSGSAP
jgi:hypothetical protein